jgi:hypothetical protein
MENKDYLAPGLAPGPYRSNLTRTRVAGGWSPVTPPPEAACGLDPAPNSRKFLQDRVHDPFGFVAAAARAWSMRGPPWTSPRASIAAFGSSFVDLTTAAWCP